MSSDDIQNTIEFLLQSQANFEVQLEKTNEQLRRTNEQLARTNEQLARTNEQLEQTNQQVSLFAETQTEFIQVMLGHVEAQREINANMRQMMRELSQAQQRSQQVTNDDISELAKAQQITKHELSELAKAQQQTQRDISDLTKIVGGLVKTVYENEN